MSLITSFKLLLKLASPLLQLLPMELILVLAAVFIQEDRRERSIYQSFNFKKAEKSMRKFEDTFLRALKVVFAAVTTIPS
jgi:hypothetical protein